jgi:hypothetical protein
VFCDASRDTLLLFTLASMLLVASLLESCCGPALSSELEPESTLVSNARCIAGDLVMKCNNNRRFDYEMQQQQVCFKGCF